jgi:hypothetical protein
MTVRYVFLDGQQLGTMYVTRYGVHVISGPKVTRFFNELGALGDNELIVHPEDDEGDRFIELARPLESKSEVEKLVEEVMVDRGYDLSPKHF